MSKREKQKVVEVDGGVGPHPRIAKRTVTITAKDELAAFTQLVTEGV